MHRRTLGLLLLAGVTACGAKPPDIADRPAPGPMPAGATWQGVYQGPYHIALNIWTRDNRAVGNWRAIGDREGEFSGTAFGNLLVLDWTERATGKNERWSGRGYFVFSAGKDGAPAQIYGEWGMGRGGRTDPWWAVKRGDQPVGDGGARLVDKADADQVDRDDGPGCEAGNCDFQETDER